MAAYNADSDTQNVIGALEEKGSEVDIFSHNCKNLSDGPVSNDEVVEGGPSTNSSDRPDNPVMFHGDDTTGKKCFKTHQDGEAETDEEEICTLFTRRQGWRYCGRISGPNASICSTNEPSSRP